MLDAAFIAAITLEAPILGALIGAVLVVVGGVWAVTRLDNNRVIEILTARGDVRLLEHAAECRARAAFADVPEPREWSSSGRFVAKTPGNGNSR
jgi:hypothetical protein